MYGRWGKKMFMLDKWNIWTVYTYQMHWRLRDELLDDGWNNNDDDLDDDNGGGGDDDDDDDDVDVYD